MNLGKNIKYLRECHGFNQEQLGDLLNVTKVSICCYERGTRTPCLETVIRLSEIFNVSLDDLVKGKCCRY